MAFPITNPALARALALRDYNEPTPVQSAVLQPEAAGRDLLVSAQTGSGKTVAYGLAFAPTLLGDAEQFTARPGSPLALVIAPTRELAMQVHGELSWLYDPTGARVVSCIGGMDARREQRLLSAGCRIVVGTPGRLKDHIERRQLDLSALRVVVLDEADEMLDLGFRDELQFILDAAPAERRTLLFSATIAREIAALARQYQANALRIDTASRNEPHEDIEYRAMRVGGHEAERAVVNVLRYFDSRATLVFCATRDGVRRLHASLQARGFAAVALSGELSQTERTAALQSLRDGVSRVCVATDVAARGLDLPDLGLVVHADLPTNHEILLHRSGRTGRAGKKGLCILIVPTARRRRAEQLIASAGVDATWSGAPSVDEILTRDQERLLADPMLAEEPSEAELAQARQLVAGRPAEVIAAALIRMYQARLPIPQELGDGGTSPEAKGVREPRASREPQGPMNWFGMALGRRDKADPKWLIPLLCRVGNLTKRDIGTIQIFDQETRFQIAVDATERFTEAVLASGEGQLRIGPVSDGPSGATPERVARPDKRPARFQARPSGVNADRGKPERIFKRKPKVKTLHA